MIKKYTIVLEDPHHILLKYLISVLVFCGLLYIPVLLIKQNAFPEYVGYMIPLGVMIILLFPISFIFNRKCEITCDDEKMSIRSIDKKLNLSEYKKEIFWKEIEGIFIPRYGVSFYNNGITKQTIILKEGKKAISFIAHPSDLNFNDFEILLGSKIPNLIYPKSYKFMEKMINRKLS
jgi:hypothetical protein